jgi:hypothetical protein
MGNFWENILLEIGLFTLLGVLYYFYQKRKIINYEQNKGPLIMGMILQSCLSEKNDEPQPQLDTLIESLDDYLHNRISNPPFVLLKVYMNSPQCSDELRNIIREGISEIESNYGQK